MTLGLPEESTENSSLGESMEESTRAFSPDPSPAISNEGTGERPTLSPSPRPPSPRQICVQAVERAARSSVLGCCLQPLLAVVSDPETCTLQMANTMQRSLSKLAQLAAQVRSGGVVMQWGRVFRSHWCVDTL